jgi:hypothetical protein
MSGYSERIVRATRQVLLEVFQLLDKFKDSLILVGGWVPIMIVPDALDKHVGTIDVDLAINDRTLFETGSETMEEILLSNGYQHGTEPGRYIRQIIIDGQSINVPVDFFTSEQSYIPKNEFFDITGISAIAAPGCEIGFDVNETIKLSGVLPNGKQYSTEIKSAGVVALIVMKALAMGIRAKTKDAYDIWFCLANHPGYLNDVVQAFLPHIEKGSVKTALSLLSGYFGSIDARGPMDVVKEEGTTSPDFRAFIRQDAFQRVQALLRGLGIAYSPATSF